MTNESQFSREDIWTAVDSLYVDISVATSFFSVIGCMVIIALFFAFKELRTTSRQLLVYLSIADIIVGMSSIVQARGYVLSIGVSTINVNRTLLAFFFKRIKKLSGRIYIKG